MSLRSDARPTEPAGKRAIERLSAFLPAIAFLGTFGVFFVDKDREATTVFKSARGLVTMIAIIGGYLVIGFVLRRVVRWAWVPPVVLTIVTRTLAAWIVRPYYVDETVNRVLAPGQSARRVESHRPRAQVRGPAAARCHADPFCASGAAAIGPGAGQPRATPGHRPRRPRHRVDHPRRRWFPRRTFRGL
jgi:hypothetical protein